jgi:DNA-binding PadR family transcriptional regulator
MASQRTGLSPLALVVLALLDEAPMYPYRMQQLIRERGNDEVVNVRHRASLYQTIARLEREGLVEVHGTARTENRPERTLYRLTEAGHETVHARLREMLALPAAEFPEFPAALSFIYLLEPSVARAELVRRAEALDGEGRRLAGLLEEHADSVPRLFLLEVEYLKTAAEAELAWVRGITDDLDAGRLTWSPSRIRRSFHAAAEDEDIA